MYFYIKAVHIVFVVTWFSGLFYIVRLFVYSAEANQKSEPEKNILLRQLGLMQRRLWYGITWPSALLTLVFGIWLGILYGSLPAWLVIKILFVLGLLMYHFTLHEIFRQQQQQIFKWTSRQLRIWNEVATLFLVAIVMLAVVKQALSAAWGVTVLVGLAVVLMMVIKLYRKYRTK